MTLPIEKGCDWNVFAYVINKEVVNINDTLCIVFQLGSFKHFEEAEKHAKSIIEKTGYSHVFVAKYGVPVKITGKPDTNVIKTVTVDLQGKLIDMETQEYKEQKEKYKQKVQYEKELVQECQQECELEHLEHYKRQAYLATKHYSAYKQFQKMAEESLKHYHDRIIDLKTHLLQHPEHEEQFLPLLKIKLLSRGEEELYNNIKNTYASIRKDILE